jgi:hypothetical protein
MARKHLRAILFRVTVVNRAEIVVFWILACPNQSFPKGRELTFHIASRSRKSAREIPRCHSLPVLDSKSPNVLPEKDDDQKFQYWCHFPGSFLCTATQPRYRTWYSRAVAPMRPTSPTALVGDYDILTIFRADRSTPSAFVHLLGKYSYIADADAADLGCDVGRDSNVRVIEDLDVAYLNVYQPIPDSGLGSRRSGEAQRQRPRYKQGYHATLYPLHMIGSLPRYRSRVLHGSE